jgi:hypothetical protein
MQSNQMVETSSFDAQQFPDSLMECRLHSGKASNKHSINGHVQSDNSVTLSCAAIFCSLRIPVLELCFVPLCIVWRLQINISPLMLTSLADLLSPGPCVLCLSVSSP